PAGLGPTATCSRTRAIARSAWKLGWSEDPDPPQPARAIPASAKRTALSGLLALAPGARLGRDRRHRGLVMAGGTIPDHVGLRHALLAGLRLHLGPGKLGLGEIVPTGQVERFKCALQSRPPMFLGAEHCPDHLELLIAEPDDPH